MLVGVRGIHSQRLTHLAMLVASPSASSPIPTSAIVTASRAASGETPRRPANLEEAPAAATLAAASVWF